MQMTKRKYGTKTHHSKVPLKFIKITIDYTEHIILKNRTWLSFIITRVVKSCQIRHPEVRIRYPDTSEGSSRIASYI